MCGDGGSLLVSGDGLVKVDLVTGCECWAGERGEGVFVVGGGDVGSEDEGGWGVDNLVDEDD